MTYFVAIYISILLVANDVSRRQGESYPFVIPNASCLHLPGVLVVIEPQVGIAILLHPYLISSFLEARNFGFPMRRSYMLQIVR